MRDALKTLSGRIADLIWPRTCAVEGCGAKVDRPWRHICSSCWRSLPWDDERHFEMAVAGRWDGLRAAFAYLPPVDRLILDFKFASKKHLARDFADAMEIAARKWFDVAAIDAVVPVPLHSNRLAKRGYNQSALIAEDLALRFDRTFLAGGISRVRDTEHQSRCAGPKRLKNVAGAFDVEHPESVRGRAILLVDDVSTTGATVAECAATLKSAGAYKVFVLIAARTLAD